MFQVAQGQHQSFLHHFLAQMPPPAHAMEAEGIQRLQHGLGQTGHCLPIALQGTLTPLGIEKRLQTGPPLRGLTAISMIA